MRVLTCVMCGGFWEDDGAAEGGAAEGSAIVGGGGSDASGGDQATFDLFVLKKITHPEIFVRGETVRKFPLFHTPAIKVARCHQGAPLTSYPTDDVGPVGDVAQLRRPAHQT